MTHATNDLVERLKRASIRINGEMLLDEAAAEIERLRAENARLTQTSGTFEHNVLLDRDKQTGGLW